MLRLYAYTCIIFLFSLLLNAAPVHQRFGDDASKRQLDVKLGQLAFLGHSMLACGIAPSEVRSRQRRKIRCFTCTVFVQVQVLHLFFQWTFRYKPNLCARWLVQNARKCENSFNGLATWLCTCTLIGGLQRCYWFWMNHRSSKFVTS